MRNKKEYSRKVRLRISTIINHKRAVFLHRQSNVTGFLLLIKQICIQFSKGIYQFPHFELKLEFSCSVVSEFLWPHGLKHARPPCPLTTPGTCSDSCPSSQWCCPTISSSVIPFSSCTTRNVLLFSKENE